MFNAVQTCMYACCYTIYKKFCGIINISVGLCASCSVHSHDNGKGEMLIADWSRHGNVDSLIQAFMRY